jgi:predicted GNAT family acetyltransferase
MAEHILDRPIWNSLTTRQAEHAIADAAARCFAPDIGPLAAAKDGSDASLAALGRLLQRHGNLVLFTHADDPLPPGAFVERSGDGVQMVGTRPFGPQSADGLSALGDADAPEMLALAHLTEPGPFMPRTHCLGQFWGMRSEGRLVAMAGERMRLPGFSEISAVCTHPDHRGRGHARKLLAFVAAQIEARGETPILHSYSDNKAALKVYESLGFAPRRTLTFKFLGRV